VGNFVSNFHRKRNLPPLAALPAFEAAARHQSFSRAAEELHLTHGAISRAVAQIEERLGIDLFVRRNRRVWLTPAGERLFKSVVTALDGLDGTVEEITVSIVRTQPCHALVDAKAGCVSRSQS
jgi:DNA-binding transcriptional LysR family regulator